MFRYKNVYFCTLVLSVSYNAIEAGRFGATWHGSGGGKHSYPSSGLNGGTSHNYPSSLGYPSTQNVSYSSNLHSYPFVGISNRVNSSGYPVYTLYAGTTNNQQLYYNPPPKIYYVSPHGGPQMTYPVYRGTLPTYVYKFRSSGTRYGILLAGLGLFNLGALTSGYVDNKQYINYEAEPDEICFFSIQEVNGDSERIRIDCKFISSFIRAELGKQQQQNYQIHNSAAVTNTSFQDRLHISPHIMPPNGTLMPLQVSSADENITNGAPAAGETIMSSMNITLTNTTIANAFDVKGPPIELKPGMECYVERKNLYSTITKKVPCGLLQAYADKSFKNISELYAERTTLRPSFNRSGDGTEHNYLWSWGSSSERDIFTRYSPYDCIHRGRRPERRGRRRRPCPARYNNRKQICDWYQQTANRGCGTWSNYCYYPPQQILYASPRTGLQINYPVYRGTLPFAVYKYKDSGSKYSSLLCGLALFDQGVNLYAICNVSSVALLPSNTYLLPSEECTFGIQKNNGDFEETRIYCREAISGIVFAEHIKKLNTINTTTGTNTTFDNTTKAEEMLMYMYKLSTFNVSNHENGGVSVSGLSSESTMSAGNMSIINSNNTLVPPTSNFSNTTVEPLSPSVTETTRNTSILRAIDVKGSPIEVTSEMKCYVKRMITSSSGMKIEIPCAVLEIYASYIKPKSDFNIERTNTEATLIPRGNGDGSANSFIRDSSSGNHQYPSLSRF